MLSDVYVFGFLVTPFVRKTLAVLVAYRVRI